MQDLVYPVKHASEEWYSNSCYNVTYQVLYTYTKYFLSMQRDNTQYEDWPNKKIANLWEFGIKNHDYRTNLAS